MTSALYPTRESDGPAHVGTMLDLRALRIQTARDNTVRCLRQARAARIAGNASAWEWAMRGAAAWRRKLAKVLP